MINANEFKPGITFQEGNNIFVVLEAYHSKKGRGQANVKSKVKNLRTGTTIIKSYTSKDKLSKAHIETKNMNYLYNDKTDIILIDKQTFAQIKIDIKKVKWELNFLKEGNDVKVRFFKNEILDIELPKNVELKVVSASNILKENISNNSQKKVMLETDFLIKTPSFIKKNELIIVSTTTGKYIGRSNK